MLLTLEDGFVWIHYTVEPAPPPS